MKVSPPFEIKVALLGNVSAGKSTVLNALLKDKYSEVAMNRTTACVNYFSVFKKLQQPEAKEVVGKDDGAENAEAEAGLLSSEAVEDNDRGDQSNKDSQPPPSSSTGPVWSNTADLPRSAESTLMEIMQDNQVKLSSHASSKVQEKFFDVEQGEYLVEMRDDTKLVLVDVPGLNEAGAGFESTRSTCATSGTASTVLFSSWMPSKGSTHRIRYFCFV